MTAPTPPPQLPAQPRSVAHQVPRLVFGAAVALLGAAVLVETGTVRGWEARVSAAMSHVITGTSTAANPAQHLFFFGLGTPATTGLRISAECSAAVLVGPLLLVGGLVLTAGRVPAHRVVLGAAIGTVVLALANFARIGLIVWSIHEWGLSRGYGWSHIVAGSVVTLVAAIGGIGLFLKIAFGGRTSNSREKS